MGKYRFKIIVILAAVGISLYFLYPTYRDHALHKDLARLSGQDSLAFVEQNEATIRDARQKRIKLGLDLQGGMRVVLEVNVLKLVEDLAKNKDDAFAQVLKEVREEARTSDQSPHHPFLLLMPCGKQAIKCSPPLMETKDYQRR